MCNVTGVAHSYKPTENHHPTAVTLGPAGPFSAFQLIVQIFRQLCFQLQQASNNRQTKKYQRAGEHRGAFSIQNARYLPQELVGSKAELKGE